MSPNAPTRTPPSVVLTALLLISFSASGLLAGTLVRVLQHAHSPVTTTSTSTTPPAATTRTPAATATLATPAGAPQSFTLVLTLSSQNVHRGDTVLVTASVLTASTQQPIQGLGVQLSATGENGAQLTPAPATVTTDGSGKATWRLTIPLDAPIGQYTVQADARWSPLSQTQDRSLYVQ